MRWKELEAIPRREPEKKGWIVKPQFTGSILLLDIYTDKEWEARYCMDTETGEHGYRKEGENWRKGKLITCIGGGPTGGYYYRYSMIDLQDLKFDSEYEEKEVNTFLKNPRWGGQSDWRDKIEYWEMDYDRDKRWEAKKREARREKEMMGQIPEIPEDFREWLYEKETEEEYVFYDKSKGKWGCSCCGEEMPDTKLRRLKDNEKVRHNDLVKCPKCGKTLLAKKRNKQMKKKTGAYLIQPVSEEVSVIRYVDVEITWEFGRYTVELEEAIRIMAYKIGVNKRRKHNVRLYYHDGWGNFSRGNRINKRAKEGYLYPGDYTDTLENTVYEDGRRVLWQFAQAGRKLNYNKLLIGIGELKNFENIAEYLFKGRFERLLTETIENVEWWGNALYYGSLELQGETLEEVFDIYDRQKINRIREENGGEEMLKWMRYSEESGQKIAKDTLRYLIENNIGPDDYKEDINNLSLQQIQNYLEKQRAAGYANLTPKEILNQWMDYLSICKAAGKNMEDAMVLKPRDLKLRHDQAVADANQLKIVRAMRANKELRQREAEKMREKYPQAEKNLEAIRERYEYQNEEYVIIVPHDLVEIIEDGQALHHCAGASERYFDRIESQETYICFLRRVETPGIPFYTIEVEPSGTIRQHRSYLDEEPGIDEIRGFLREWQKILKKRLTKEDVRLAKISKEKREQNIRELEEKNNTRVLKGLAEDFMESLLEEVV